MITAIILATVESDQIPEVAETITSINGVSEVYSVTGDVDLIIMVRVREFDEIAAVISNQIAKVPGIISTQTHLAFQAFSQHDLDATFTLGS